MFAKGNKMIPLVRDWRELSKGVLGVDYQGKEGKGSEVGAISAHPVLWPLLSPGYPQEGQEGLGFLGGIHDVNVGGLLDLHQGTSPWALHLAPSKQPRDPDGSAGKESSCTVRRHN